MATLAQMTNALEPALRKAAGLGSWQLISPSAGDSIAGTLHVADSLAKARDFESPAVLLIDEIEGDEDIPEVLLLNT